MISMSYTEFNANFLVDLSKFVTEFLYELTKHSVDSLALKIRQEWIILKSQEKTYSQEG